MLYPAGHAVAVNYRGSYFGLGDAYAVLCRHMTENGYVPAGYPQEIYLEIDADGSVQPDDADNITRVIVPIVCDGGAQKITY